MVLNGIICCGKEEELVWEECFKFFGNEIVVVYDVVGNYLFVNMIVSIILEKVYVCGVWIEDILCEWFEKVFSVCKKVVVIDECGGILYKYFIFYL